MAALAGFSHEELDRHFVLMNVLRKWPGKAGKGDAFPKAQARAVACRLEPLPDHIVFVGQAVAGIFGFRGSPLRWQRWGRGRAAMLPHPSGVNRWYNDRRNRAAAARFLRRAAKL